MAPSAKEPMGRLSLTVGRTAIAGRGPRWSVLASSGEARSARLGGRVSFLFCFLAAGLSESHSAGRGHGCIPTYRGAGGRPYVNPGGVESVIGDITVEQDVRLTVADGVALSADVYAPARRGRYPTLLMRLPYGAAVASSAVYRHPAWYASQGFCVVIQDVRGTWRSGGSFYPRYEEADTLAAIEWAAALPRSNGHVGMYGFSYQGLVQLQAAAAGSSELAAIAPAQTAAGRSPFSTITCVTVVEREKAGAECS